MKPHSCNNKYCDEEEKQWRQQVAGLPDEEARDMPSSNQINTRAQVASSKVWQMQRLVI